MTLRPCQHFWPIKNPKTQGIHPIWANHPGLSPSVRLGPLPGDLEVPSKNQSILGASGFVYDFWSENVQHGFFPGWFLGFYLSGWYPKKSIVFKTCCVDWWVDLLILLVVFGSRRGPPLCRGAPPTLRSPAPSALARSTPTAAPWAAGSLFLETSICSGRDFWLIQFKLPGKSHEVLEHWILVGFVTSQAQVRQFKSNFWRFDRFVPFSWVK